MRDFFSHQDAARRNGRKLLLFFGLATLWVVVVASSAIYLLMTFELARLRQAANPFTLALAGWDWRLWSQIAAGVLAFTLICTLYKYLQIRNGGGAIIAQMSGGRPVFPDTRDFRERRLLNIVEEMALAAGVTVPTVYLLEREEGINAFAAGFSQEDAVIGVTRGALLYLERDELQGVVAHEFSHILYGDMLINVRLHGVLHGIVALGLLGRILLHGTFRGGAVARGRVSAGRGGGGALLLLAAGLALTIIGSIGGLVGKLVKSAIVRQREFLADASAVQFTRNPGGLAGALKKIGGLDEGGRIRDHHAAELSHLYFGNALNNGNWSWLSTHPPLLERIRRLEPGFKGQLPSRRVQPVAVSEEEALALAPGFTGSPLLAVPGSHAGVRELPDGPSPERLQLAREMLADLPAAVRTAARDPFSARAVIYGLLLAHDRKVGAFQLATLKREADPGVWRELARLGRVVAAIDPDLRLSLLDLLLPALKTLSRPQYRKFRQNVHTLTQAGPRTDLFAFTLQHLLLKRLDRHFGLKGKQDGQQDRAAPAAPMGQHEQLSCVLSLLARYGHCDEREAGKAFMRGIRQFTKEMKYLEYLTDRVCTLDNFAAALAGLEQAGMAVKENLLASALATIADDGVVTVRESQLFRLIAESLGLPAPPWLADGQTVYSNSSR